MVKWVNRTLLLGPRLALVASQRDYRQALRRAGQPVDGQEFCPDGCKAVTHSWTEGGEVYCVVGIHPDAFQAEGIEVASVLCHEAVHVWQRFASAGNLDGSDGAWGRESAAYAIENISRELMRAFSELSSSAAVAAGRAF